MKCLICVNSDEATSAVLTPLTSEALVARRVVSAPVELIFLSNQLIS